MSQALSNFRAKPLHALAQALAVVAIAVASASAQAAPVVYSQTWNGTGQSWASQNTTSGGNGNFATAYDNFTLGADTEITDVHWTGSYFNSQTPGAISGWTIRFYADNAGTPGAALFTEGFGGNANETFAALTGEGAAFRYNRDLASPFAAIGGTQYWLSLVPDLPTDIPQWGWAPAVAPPPGDGNSVQDFFGQRFVRQPDLAFDLTGNRGISQVPEPATLALLGLGLAGLGAMRRRKQS